MIVHLSTEEVRQWLKALGQDRLWLAHEIGASNRTVDNWFTDKALPLWAQKSIRMLMQLNNPDVLNPRFTSSEWRTVESASRALGFPSTDEFILAAVLEKARGLPQIDRPLSLVAEEPAEYKTGKSEDPSASSAKSNPASNPNP